MRKVAEFAVGKGWPLPKPTDPLDSLTKLFADAARDSRIIAIQRLESRIGLITLSEGANVFLGRYRRSEDEAHKHARIAGDATQQMVDDALN